MFYVGQKVICVDASRADPSTIRPYPFIAHHNLVKGQIYTIVAVGLTNDLDLLNRPCVAIAEHKFKHAYIASRFRPLTDISVFTVMLNEKKITEDV
jgi:hypothetical protein